MTLSATEAAFTTAALVTVEVTSLRRLQLDLEKEEITAIVFIGNQSF